MEENSITVQGTTENKLFQNEAYIGELISIDYADTLKVENQRLNFHINGQSYANDIGGIFYRNMAILC